MGVYLGNNGRIMLRRQGGKSTFLTKLESSDINLKMNRFSIDGAVEQFITGDRLEISTLPETDEIPLTLVPSNTNPSGIIQSSFSAFIHVDAVGGIRLYETLADAINGTLDAAVKLGDVAEPGLDVGVEIIARTEESCLGLVRNFTITTARSNIDTTCLSQQYRESYDNGLIQGQGQISCYWDYAQDCESLCMEEKEFASYLAKLCIRVVQGSSFHGYFYLYAAEFNVGKSVWYECEDCVINNVAISLTPDQLVQAEISFVTSGPIRLREGALPGYLEQEQDESFILNEDGHQIQLENSES